MDGVSSPPAPDLTDSLLGLSQPQCQVLSLVCEELTIQQIVGWLGLHPRTVGLYIRGLKERFWAENIPPLAGRKEQKSGFRDENPCCVGRTGVISGLKT
jgi:hypothetical protein